MLHQVIFDDYWRRIKVAAYTDLYAYDPEDASLLFISIAGTDQAVKAISSAIIGCKTVIVRTEPDIETLVNGHPTSRYRVFSTKLPNGAIHQLVADTGFFGNDETGEKLVLIPEQRDVASVVHAQVLAGLASPIIPEWSAWICAQLMEMDRMREMEGTLRVAQISANEEIVDEIVSQGLRTGRISLDETGGTYAGFH